MTIKESEMHSDVLVEVLLGFLSKQSTLLLKISEQVFASFASTLTSAGLQLLLDVLLTPETVNGAQELFDNEDVVMEDGVSEDDEDGEDEDEDADEDVDMEDELEADYDANDELDAALSAALGAAKAPDDSSDEELMNDDEMMALDDNLAAVFRQRLKPNRKKENADTKLQMSTFKCKVVDLLDILVKEQVELSLEMALPLLQVLRLTKSDTVHSKIITLLRKVAKQKELPTGDDKLMDLLRKVHRDAGSARQRDGSIHSQMSIYIARIARKAGKEDEVIAVYAETMKKWVKNGKSNVRTGLFTDWINWCQSIRR
jgi:DNA polymerase phi